MSLVLPYGGWLLSVPLPCDREALIGLLRRVKASLQLGMLASLGVLAAGIVFLLWFSRGFGVLGGFSTVFALFFLFFLGVGLLAFINEYQWYGYVSWLLEAVESGRISVESVCGRSLREVRR